MCVAAGVPACRSLFATHPFVLSRLRGLPPYIGSPTSDYLTKEHLMNRRSFLKVTSTAAAAAALLPASHAANKRNLRKAIMYSTIGVKGSVLEKFKAMKAAGFEGVEPMGAMNRDEVRSEEHTSELQSQSKVVCRLLLE